MAGGKYDTDLFERVTLTSERFQLDLPEAKVEIRLDPMKPRRLQGEIERLHGKGG